MTTRFAVRLAAALAALVLSTTHVGGQVVRSASERGWIGLSFDIVESPATAGAVATVVDVSSGSPAERAGIRVGDVLVSINGRGWEEELARITGTLRPGDLVRLVLDRGGQRLPLRLNAGARPAQMVTTPAWSFTFQVDSMADLMYRAMDSLRVHLVQSDGSVRLLRLPRAPGDPTTLFHDAATSALPPVAPAFRAGEPRFGFPEAEATDFALVQEVKAPFAFYLFRGQIHDSLRQEMDQLNGEIRRLRSQEATRARDVARVVASPGGRGFGSGEDQELRLVQERLTEYGIRAERLRDAMTRAARREATSRRTTGQPSDSPGALHGTSAEPEAFFRPLTPYLLGQNRAAGAEVVELGPELAEYFRVEGGVLVVDVPPGTPAAQAGMQPGDVVTHVDGTAVRSIDGLRAGIARGSSDPTLTLVRKGRRIQVLLMR